MRRFWVIALAGALYSGLASGQSDGSNPATTAAPGEPAPHQGDDASQTERAREAFTLGSALAAQGQWADALSAFVRSSVLKPHPATTYNMAYCERALGHATRAYTLFRRALEEHAAAVTGTLPPNLFAVSQSYEAEMERRIVKVRVRMEPGAAPLSVDGARLQRLDIAGRDSVMVAGARDERGSELPPASSFELWVDPGRHVLIVSRPGTPDSVRDEDFRAGGFREIVLGGPTETPARKTERAAAPNVEAHASSSGRVWAYAAFGTAAGGLAIGSIFGAATLSKKNFLDSECATRSTCDRRFQGDIDAMNRDGAISTVGFGVALLGAGIGTYLYLTTSPTSRESAGSKVRASVVPLVSPSGIGAYGRF